MDPIKNPFSPGAGSPPPELVGRGAILEQARVLLGRTKLKRPRVEPGGDQSDHVGNRPGRNRNRSGTARPEFLPRPVRSIDAGRDAIPARDGRTWRRPSPHERYCRHTGGEGHQPGAGASEAHQQGDDLQSGVWRSGVHRTVVRPVHDPHPAFVRAVVGTSRNALKHRAPREDTCA